MSSFVLARSASSSAGRHRRAWNAFHLIRHEGGKPHGEAASYFEHFRIRNCLRLRARAATLAAHYALGAPSEKGDRFESTATDGSHHKRQASSFFGYRAHPSADDMCSISERLCAFARNETNEKLDARRPPLNPNYTPSARNTKTPFPTETVNWSLGSALLSHDSGRQSPLDANKRRPIARPQPDYCRPSVFKCDFAEQNNGIFNF